MIVTVHTPKDYEVFLKFAHERGVTVPPTVGSTFRVIGRLDSNKQLVAVLELSGFAKRTCNVHVTGKMTPDLIRAMIRYAFVTSNLVQIFGHISANNKKLQDLAKFVGFKELCTVKCGWDDATDLVVVGLHRSQCRLLKES